VQCQSRSKGERSVRVGARESAVLEQGRVQSQSKSKGECSVSESEQGRVQCVSRSKGECRVSKGECSVRVEARESAEPARESAVSESKQGRVQCVRVGARESAVLEQGRVQCQSRSKGERSVRARESAVSE
jgi:hypothetical protein